MIEQRSAAVHALQVWDRVVRIGHWLLVASVLAAWLTRHGGGALHEYLGYVALGIVAIRLAWGWWSAGHARFGNFLRGPRETWSYARHMLARREPRHLGHNPLGAWMIVALLLSVCVVGASGWLYTTDEYWGVAWVEAVHSISTNVLLVLAAVHVMGVLYASLRHRENLIAAMLHGRKRPAEDR
jgi:cytochrome b